MHLPKQRGFIGSEMDPLVITTTVRGLDYPTPRNV